MITDISIFPLLFWLHIEYHINMLGYALCCINVDKRCVEHSPNAGRVTNLKWKPHNFETQHFGLLIGVEFKVQHHKLGWQPLSCS